jgi:hypothetical protein
MEEDDILGAGGVFIDPVIPVPLGKNKLGFITEPYDNQFTTEEYRRRNRPSILDLDEYDAGMQEIPTERRAAQRAANQSGSEQFFNMIGRGVAKGTIGLVGSTANILDWDNWLTLVGLNDDGFNDDREGVLKGISDVVDLMKQDIDTALPINRAAPMESWDVTDGGWWATHGDSLISSGVEFGLLGFGVGSAVGKGASYASRLSRVMAASEYQTLRQAGNVSSEAITQILKNNQLRQFGIDVTAEAISSTVLSAAEGFTTAKQVFKDNKEFIKNNLSYNLSQMNAAPSPMVSKFTEHLMSKNMSRAEFDALEKPNKERIIDEFASIHAGESAASTARLNMWTMITNLGTLSAVTKLNKVGNRLLDPKFALKSGESFSEYATRLSQLQLKSQGLNQVKQAAKTLGKEGSKEMIEEWFNAVAERSGKRDALAMAGFDIQYDNLWDWAVDKSGLTDGHIIEQMMAGFVGGVSQQGALKGVAYGAHKLLGTQDPNAYDTQYREQLKALQAQSVMFGAAQSALEQLDTAGDLKAAHAAQMTLNQLFENISTQATDGIMNHGTASATVQMYDALSRISDKMLSAVEKSQDMSVEEKTTAKGYLTRAKESFLKHQQELSQLENEWELIKNSMGISDLAKKIQFRNLALLNKLRGKQDVIDEMWKELQADLYKLFTVKDDTGLSLMDKIKTMLGQDVNPYDLITALIMKSVNEKDSTMIGDPILKILQQETKDRAFRNKWKEFIDSQKEVTDKFAGHENVLSGLQKELGEDNALSNWFSAFIAKHINKINKELTEEKVARGSDLKPEHTADYTMMAAQAHMTEAEQTRLRSATTTAMSKGDNMSEEELKAAEEAVTALEKRRDDYQASYDAVVANKSKLANSEDFNDAIAETKNSIESFERIINTLKNTVQQARAVKQAAAVASAASAPVTPPAPAPVVTTPPAPAPPAPTSPPATPTLPTPPAASTPPPAPAATPAPVSNQWQEPSWKEVESFDMSYLEIDEMAVGDRQWEGSKANQHTSQERKYFTATKYETATGSFVIVVKPNDSAIGYAKPGQDQKFKRLENIVQIMEGARAANWSANNWLVTDKPIPQSFSDITHERTGLEQITGQLVFEQDSSTGKWSWDGSSTLNAKVVDLNVTATSAPPVAPVATPAVPVPKDQAQELLSAFEEQVSNLVLAGQLANSMQSKEPSGFFSGLTPEQQANFNNLKQKHFGATVTSSPDNYTAAVLEILDNIEAAVNMNALTGLVSSFPDKFTEDQKALLKSKNPNDAGDIISLLRSTVTLPQKSVVDLLVSLNSFGDIIHYVDSASTLLTELNNLKNSLTTGSTSPTILSAIQNIIAQNFEEAENAIKNYADELRKSGTVLSTFIPPQIVYGAGRIMWALLKSGGQTLNQILLSIANHISEKLKSLGVESNTAAKAANTITARALKNLLKELQSSEDFTHSEAYKLISAVLSEQELNSITDSNAQAFLVKLVAEIDNAIKQLESNKLSTITEAQQVIKAAIAQLPTEQQEEATAQVKEIFDILPDAAAIGFVAGEDPNLVGTSLQFKVESSKSVRVGQVFRQLQHTKADPVTIKLKVGEQIVDFTVAKKLNRIADEHFGEEYDTKSLNSRKVLPGDTVRVKINPTGDGGFQRFITAPVNAAITIYEKTEVLPTGLTETKAVQLPLLLGQGKTMEGIVRAIAADPAIREAYKQAGVEWWQLIPLDIYRENTKTPLAPVQRAPSTLRKNLVYQLVQTDENGLPVFDGSGKIKLKQNASVSLKVAAKQIGKVNRVGLDEAQIQLKSFVDRFKKQHTVNGKTPKIIITVIAGENNKLGEAYDLTTGQKLTAQEYNDQVLATRMSPRLSGSTQKASEVAEGEVVADITEITSSLPVGTVLIGIGNLANGNDNDFTYETVQGTTVSTDFQLLVADLLHNSELFSNGSQRLFQTRFKEAVNVFGQESAQVLAGSALRVLANRVAGLDTERELIEAFNDSIRKMSYTYTAKNDSSTGKPQFFSHLRNLQKTSSTTPKIYSALMYKQANTDNALPLSVLNKTLDKFLEITKSLPQDTPDQTEYVQQMHKAVTYLKAQAQSNQTLAKQINKAISKIVDYHGNGDMQQMLEQLDSIVDEALNNSELGITVGTTEGDKTVVFNTATFVRAINSNGVTVLEGELIDRDNPRESKKEAFNKVLKGEVQEAEFKMIAYVQESPKLFEESQGWRIEERTYVYKKNKNKTVIPVLKETRTIGVAPNSYHSSGNGTLVRNGIFNNFMTYTLSKQTAAFSKQFLNEATWGKGIPVGVKKSGNRIEIEYAYSGQQGYLNFVQANMQTRMIPEQPLVNSMLFLAPLNPVAATQAPAQSAQSIEDAESYAFSIGSTDQLNTAIEQEIAEFKKRYPEVRASVAERIFTNITSEEAFGEFRDGAITVSRFSQTGTTYHEAFHVVFNLFTKPNEKAKLLREARVIYGDPDASKLNALSKRYPQLPNDQVLDLYYEEEMADSFRDYVVNRSKSKTLWNTVKNFFKDLVAAIRMFLLNDVTLENYFRVAWSPVFRPRTLVTKKPKLRKYSVSDKIGVALTDLATEAITSIFVHKFNEKIEADPNKRSRNTIANLSTSEFKKIVKNIKGELVFAVFEKFKKGVSIELTEEEKRVVVEYISDNQLGTFDETQVADESDNVKKVLEYIYSNIMNISWVPSIMSVLYVNQKSANEIEAYQHGESLVSIALSKLKAIGYPVTFVEETVEPQSLADTQARGDIYDKPVFKSDSFNKTSVAVKGFLSSIVNVNDEFSIFKLPKLYSLAEVKEALQQTLYGYSTIEQFEQMLAAQVNTQKPTKYTPILVAVHQRLAGIGNEQDRKRLVRMLATDLHKQVVRLTTLKLAKPKKVDGKTMNVMVMDSNRNARARLAYEVWANNFTVQRFYKTEERDGVVEYKLKDSIMSLIGNSRLKIDLTLDIRPEVNLILSSVTKNQKNNSELTANQINKAALTSITLGELFALFDFPGELVQEVHNYVLALQELEAKLTSAGVEKSNELKDKEAALRSAILTISSTFKDLVTGVVNNPDKSFVETQSGRIIRVFNAISTLSTESPRIIESHRDGLGNMIYPFTPHSSLTSLVDELKGGTETHFTEAITGNAEGIQNASNVGFGNDRTDFQIEIAAQQTQKTFTDGIIKYFTYKTLDVVKNDVEGIKEYSNFTSVDFNALSLNLWIGTRYKADQFDYVMPPFADSFQLGIMTMKRMDDETALKNIYIQIKQELATIIEVRKIQNLVYRKVQRLENETTEAYETRRTEMALNLIENHHIASAKVAKDILGRLNAAKGLKFSNYTFLNDVVDFDALYKLVDDAVIDGVYNEQEVLSHMDDLLIGLNLYAKAQLTGMVGNEQILQDITAIEKRTGLDVSSLMQTVGKAFRKAFDNYIEASKDYERLRSNFLKPWPNPETDYTMFGQHIDTFYTVTEEGFVIKKEYENKLDQEWWRFTGKTAEDVETSLTDTMSTHIDYMLNWQVANFEMKRITSGHESFYQSKEDWTKRFKQSLTPGPSFLPDSTNESYTMATISDISGELNPNRQEAFSSLQTLLQQSYRAIESSDSSNEEIAELLKNTESVSEVWNPNDSKPSVSTDGAAWITLDHYKQLQEKKGEWGPEFEDIYRLLKGVFDRVDNGEIEFIEAVKAIKKYTKHYSKAKAFRLFVQPLKTFAYTIKPTQVAPGVWVMKPIQEKHSMVVLNPMLTLGIGRTSPINQLRMRMEAKGKFSGLQPIDVVNHASAVKVGKQKVNNWQNLDSWVTETVPFAAKREPQTVKNHEESNLWGSQFKKLIMANLIKDGNYHYYNKGSVVEPVQVSGAQLESLYENVSTSMLKADYHMLQQELGITDEFVDLLNSSDVLSTPEEIETKQKRLAHLKNEHVKKLRSFLYRQLNSREMADNYLKILDLREVNGVWEFNIPLGFPVYARKFESVMLAIYKNNVMKQRLNGRSLVQIADYGTTTLDNTTRYDKELQFKKEPNGEGWYAEVRVSHEILKKYGIENYESLTPEQQNSLYILGYRIPTQAKNSLIRLKVVDILPKESGESIQVPGDITKLQGSDFDIDKLFLVEYNTTESGIIQTNITPDQMVRLSNPNMSIEEVRELALELQNQNKPSLIAEMEDELNKLNGYLANEEIRDAISIVRSSELKKAILYLATKKAEQEIIEDDLVDYEPEVLNQYFQELLIANVREFIENGQTYDSETDYKKAIFEELETDPVGQMIIDVDQYNMNANRKVELAVAFRNPLLVLSRKQKENLIIDISHTVMTSPFHIAETLTPLDSDVIKNMAKAMEQLHASKTTKHQVYPGAYATLAANNLIGKQLVGLFAIHNVAHALGQVAQLQINYDYGTSETQPDFNKDKHLLSFASGNDVEYLENFNKIFGEDGKYIIDEMGQLITMAVDNGKDPLAGKLNINWYTSDVVAMLVRGGLGLTFALQFVNMGGVRSFISYIQNEQFIEINRMNELAEEYLLSKYPELFKNPEVVEALLSGALPVDKNHVRRTANTLSEDFDISGLAEARSIGYFLKAYKQAKALATTNKLLSTDRALMATRAEYRNYLQSYREFVTGQMLFQVGNPNYKFSNSYLEQGVLPGLALLDNYSMISNEDMAFVDNHALGYFDKKSLGDELSNNLASEYAQFLLTLSSNYPRQSSAEIQEMLTNLWNDIQQLRLKHSTHPIMMSAGRSKKPHPHLNFHLNKFINILKYDSLDGNNQIQTVNGLSRSLAETNSIVDAFEFLLQVSRAPSGVIITDEDLLEIKKVAFNLVKYAALKEGTSFSPTGFINLLPVSSWNQKIFNGQSLLDIYNEIKVQYSESTEINKMILIEKFLRQFVQFHPELHPKVYQSSKGVVTLGSEKSEKDLSKGGKASLTITVDVRKVKKKTGDTVKITNLFLPESLTEEEKQGVLERATAPRFLTLIDANGNQVVYTANTEVTADWGLNNKAETKYEKVHTGPFKVQYRLLESKIDKTYDALAVDDLKTSPLQYTIQNDPRFTQVLEDNERLADLLKTGTLLLLTPAQVNNLPFNKAVILQTTTDEGISNFTVYANEEVYFDVHKILNADSRGAINFGEALSILDNLQAVQRHARVVLGYSFGSRLTPEQSLQNVQITARIDSYIKAGDFIGLVNLLKSEIKNAHRGTDTQKSSAAWLDAWKLLHEEVIAMSTISNPVKFARTIANRVPTLRLFKTEQTPYVPADMRTNAADMVNINAFVFNDSQFPFILGLHGTVAVASQPQGERMLYGKQTNAFFTQLPKTFGKDNEQINTMLNLHTWIADNKSIQQYFLGFIVRTNQGQLYTQSNTSYTISVGYKDGVPVILAKALINYNKKDKTVTFENATKVAITKDDNGNYVITDEIKELIREAIIFAQALSKEAVISNEIAAAFIDNMVKNSKSGVLVLPVRTPTEAEINSQGDSKIAYAKTKESSQPKATPVFDSLPSARVTKSMRYAGIGSRQTPADVLGLMKQAAAYLESLGYTLTSGGAQGADLAFESGVKQQKEIYLPTGTVTDNAIKVAHEIHPNLAGAMAASKNKKIKEKIQQGATQVEAEAAGEQSALFVEKLMARNTYQIFGQDLNNPVDFVLFWAEEVPGSIRPKGGTGQAVEMARRKGIPTINMANSNWRQELAQVIQQAQSQQKATTESNQLIELQDVYNNVSELSAVGSFSDYVDYTKTIFPDSSINRILYHGSNQKFEEFDRSKSTDGSTLAVSAQMGLFFTNNKQLAEYYKDKSDINSDEDIYTKRGLNYFKTIDEVYSILEDIYNLPVPTVVETFYSPEYEDNIFATSDGKYYSGGVQPVQQISKDRYESLKAEPGFVATTPVDSNKIPLESPLFARIENILGKPIQDRSKEGLVNYMRTEVNAFRYSYSPDKTVYNVLLNAQNPYVVDFNNAERKTGDFIKTINQAKENNNDSVVIKNTKDPLKTDVFIVFDAQQVHILGSSKDVEMFKNYKNQAIINNSAYEEAVQLQEQIQQLELDINTLREIDSWTFGRVYQYLKGMKFKTSAIEKEVGSLRANKHMIRWVDNDSRNTPENVAERIAAEEFNGRVDEYEIRNMIIEIIHGSPAAQEAQRLLSTSVSQLRSQLTEAQERLKKCSS